MVGMLNPVHLVLGEDEFLAERATKQIVAEAGDGVEVTTLKAGEVSEGEIAMATSPSLFAEDRVVVFEHTELAGKEPTEVLLRACVDPAPGITLVVQHTGGGRQKAMVKKFAKVAQVHTVDPLKEGERRTWLAQEFRSHGVRPTPDVAAAVLESVGSDLRELASAVSQLVSDTEGELTVEAVRAYYVGVAEVAGFDIADQAVAGRADRALASTRRALQLGLRGAAGADAGLVAEWQERLARFADDLTPVMAPARARQRIREHLGHGLAPLSVDPLERRPWWRRPLGILAILLVATVVWYVWGR